MLALISNVDYLVEGVEMTFLKTIKNGEVAVFEINGITIKFDTGSLMEMDIEQLS